MDDETLADGELVNVENWMGRREVPAARVPGPSIGFRVVSRTMDVMARLLRWRWITEGIDNIPSSGGAVITWNHHSELDFMATACEVYIRTGRPARILATAELWRSAPMRWMLRMVDAIPVERRSRVGRRDTLQAAVDALRDGHLVLVAPEGRISPSLELLPFKTGAVRMAQRADVPLVPSAAWGTQRVWTVGHRDLRALFGLPVSCTFGGPIVVDPDDDAREVTEQLRRTTFRLLDEVQRSYPDGVPTGARWVPRRLGGTAPPSDVPEPPE